MPQYDGSNISPEVIAALPPFLQAQIPLWTENLQPDIYAALAVCHTLACAAVALRLYARRLKAQPLWWDDWLILIALIFNFAFAAVIAAATYFGTGRHLVVNVLNQPELITASVRTAWIGAILHYPPLTFTKYSLLCLYHRIFSEASYRFKHICIAGGIIATCHGLSAMLTIVFTCTPIQAYWDPNIPDSHCINYDIALRFFSGANVVTDATILILPMPLIWRMKTSIARKVQISGVFFLGSIVTVVSIIRAYYTGKTILAFKIDATYVGSYQFLWATAETGIGILAACLPILRPVLNKMLYGSVESAATRARSAAWSAPSRDGSNGAHLVTIGGRRLPLRSDVASPSGGAGTRRASKVSFVGDDTRSSIGPSHESV